MFFPQGGSGVSQFSGYSFSTTTWTRKLRWELGQDGDGFIFSSIDGTTNSYPWEVNNASRVIKTVVLLGYRGASYTLADMRIHDINLVADLTACTLVFVHNTDYEYSTTTTGSQIRKADNLHLCFLVSITNTFFDVLRAV